MSRIESTLAALEVDWPETPDVWPQIESRLVAPQKPWWRPVAVAVAVTIAAVSLGAALLAAVPAIADRLGIGAVEIEAAPVDAATSRLQLGEQVEGTAGVPVPAELGTPDAAFVADGIGWLVYAPRRDLPEVLESGVGALVARIDGEAALEKVIDTATTERRDVTVGGASGIWLEGGAHEVYVFGRDGDAGIVEGRLAGNTLIWVEGDVTYRLELALPLDDALRIAESMEP